MAKTPDEMMGAVSASLAERTGKTMDEWVALVQASGIDPLDQNAVRRWLRTEHGVPQNSQWAIADAAARAAGWVRPSTAEYIDSQYTGAKAALRPIYDALAAAAGELGGDRDRRGPGQLHAVRPRPAVRRRRRRHQGPGGSRAAVHRPARGRPPPAVHRARPVPPTRSRCAAWRTWTTGCCTCCAWPTSRTLTRPGARARYGW
jgi:hypothetical protein